MATYSVLDDHLIATIDYPEATAAEMILALTILAVLVATACTSPPPSNDVLVATALMQAGDWGDECGGTDYSHAAD